MGDDRKRQAQRIRAARDWLDEAGDSLEQGADIRGDLKVMLAQAELARAKETARPPLWRRCGRRCLPLAAAFSVVALGLFLRPASAPPEMPLTAPAPTAATLPAAPAQADDVDDVPVPAVPQAAAAPVAREAAQSSSAAVLPEPAASPPAAREDAAPPARQAQAAHPPSPEMQKLMQSAGKVLRAS